MVFASASRSASPTASASRPRIDLSSSRRFTGRRSVLSSRRPFVGASDAHHHRRVGSRIDVSVVAAAAASNADDEIAMLTKMLQLAKERKVHETTTTGDDQKTTSKGGYDGTRFDFWDSFRLESAFLRRRKKEIFSRLSRTRVRVEREGPKLEPQKTMGTDRRRQYYYVFKTTTTCSSSFLIDRSKKSVSVRRLAEAMNTY